VYYIRDTRSSRDITFLDYHRIGEGVSKRVIFSLVGIEISNIEDKEFIWER
jgi:hypothetical protein